MLSLHNAVSCCKCEAQQHDPRGPQGPQGRLASSYCCCQHQQLHPLHSQCQYCALLANGAGMQKLHEELVSVYLSKPETFPSETVLAPACLLLTSPHDGLKLSGAGMQMDSALTTHEMFEKVSTATLLLHVADTESPKSSQGLLGVTDSAPCAQHIRLHCALPHPVLSPCEGNGVL